jgi:hypothetical protein
MRKEKLLKREKEERSILQTNKKGKKASLDW